MSVAQGGTWSDVVGPILDAAGAPITNAVTDFVTVNAVLGHSLRVTAVYDPEGVSHVGVVFLSSHVGNGLYRIWSDIEDDALLGNWTVLVTYNNSVDPAKQFLGGFEVVSVFAYDPTLIRVRDPFATGHDS